jgi:F0F1-type ATP synthase assembly protein I
MMGSHYLVSLAPVAWFLAGSMAEVLNNALRHWSIGRLGLEQPRSAGFGLLVGFVLRVVLTALVLMLAFRHDTASGFAALIGYWICRWTIIWRLHRSISRKGFHISG